MNRNNDNDHGRKNHYADFDAHGNKRGGRNRNDNRSGEAGRSRDLDRFSDRNKSDYSAYDNSDNRNGGNYEHPRFGARAYGDMRGGTTYGEGGSTYGGGSAYGRSNYGMSGEHGPDYRRNNRHDADAVRNGYGDYTDYSSRNYGSFGDSNYHGNMNRNNRGGGSSGSGYGPTGRENTGYDRGFDAYGNTGYGATGYNNRDLDRERSAYRNRTFENAARFDASGDGRDYNPRGRGNQDSNNRSNRYSDR